MSTVPMRSGSCHRPRSPLRCGQRSPPEAGAEAMGPQDLFRVLGLFSWSSGREAPVSEIEIKHYLEGEDVLEWAQETRAAMVDLKFCDLLGTWQHMTLPVRAFDDSAFDEGLGFDGSSIRGWRGISESDMLLMPQAETAVLDPAAEAPTLSLVCEIAD